MRMRMTRPPAAQCQVQGMHRAHGRGRSCMGAWVRDWRTPGGCLVVLTARCRKNSRCCCCCCWLDPTPTPPVLGGPPRVHPAQLLPPVVPADAAEGAAAGRCVGPDLWLALGAAGVVLTGLTGVLADSTSKSGSCSRNSAHSRSQRDACGTHESHAEVSARLGRIDGHEDSRCCACTTSP